MIKNIAIPEVSNHLRISDYAHRFGKTAPEREAVVCGNARVTYRELSVRVEDCAKALLAMGIKKGDRIATLCTPRADYWVIFLATTSIGAIWVGINPKYTLDECRYVIGDAKPRLLFSLDSFEGRDYQPYTAALLQEYECIEQIITIDQPIFGAVAYRDFIADGHNVEASRYTQAIAAVDTMDAALLVYTSGSSGKPKGALLSHYSLCFGATVQNQYFGVTQPSITCSFPINHVACVADTCCVVLVAGGTLYFQERFDSGLVLKTIDQEHITMLGGVPTMLLMLLDHPNFIDTDFSNVELILWGGAAMPEPMIKRLQALGPRLMNVYGMTETAANTTYSSPSASIEELRDTIGRPSSDMPCRIMNAEGNVCEPNEHGELQFKGEYLMLGYFNRPEATRDAFTDDGWLHTGDLGYWRDDGAITLVGRLTEMFKSGGYNVYPREIENLLESHPAVELAAVVGVPDDRFQEVGAAFVVCNTDAHPVDASQLKAHCVEHLANYKIPKTFTLVDKLPTLPVGKVDKVALKQRALARKGETASV